MWKWIGIYFLCISLVAFFITTYDKIASKKFPRKRIPEFNLLLVGFIGGATAMYITMKTIRHKTKKKKFMISLPLMMILHVGVLGYLYWKGLSL